MREQYRECWRKVQFPDEEAALLEAAVLGFGEVVVYGCSECHWYHWKAKP